MTSAATRVVLRRSLARAALVSSLAMATAACSPEQAAEAPPAPAAARPEPIDFDAFERTDFSQFGEDGVIEKIFEIIPPTTRYAVEFGASGGIVHSNTRSLILNKGWSSLQMEGNKTRAAKLAEAYADHPNVVTRHVWIFPGNVEILFEEAGVPKDLDLLVIDIDSNDYYVWRAIHEYRPKVVLIEANVAFPPPQKAVIHFHPLNYWDGTTYAGASLQSMYELGKRKGYELIHMMRRGPNLFFVDAQYYDRFGIDDNSPEKLWRPRKHGPHPMQYPPGKRTLKVEAHEIPKIWVTDR